MSRRKEPSTRWCCTLHCRNTSNGSPKVWTLSNPQALWDKPYDYLVFLIQSSERAYTTAVLLGAYTENDRGLLSYVPSCEASKDHKLFLLLVWSKIHSAQKGMVGYVIRALHCWSNQHRDQCDRIHQITYHQSREPP